MSASLRSSVRPARSTRFLILASCVTGALLTLYAPLVGFCVSLAGLCLQAGSKLRGRAEEPFSPQLVVALGRKVRRLSAHRHSNEADGMVYLTAQYLAHGVLVIGDPGSGKTSLLVSMLSQVVESGGGGVVFAGADVATIHHVCFEAERHGREDDVVGLVVEEDDETIWTDILHHAPGIDVFGALHDEDVVDFLHALPWYGHGREAPLDIGPGKDADASWSARAKRLLRVVVPVLRHRSRTRLSIHAFASEPSLEWMIEASQDVSLSECLRSEIRDYLERLPGFDAERGRRQSRSVDDQHSAAAWSVCRCVSEILSRSPRTFARDGDPALSLVDVILGRRILVVASCATYRPYESRVLTVVANAVAKILSSVVSSELEAGRGFDRRRPFLIVDDCAQIDADPLIAVASTNVDAGIGVVTATEALLHPHQPRHPSTVHGTGTTVVMSSHDLDTFYAVFEVDRQMAKAMRAGDFILANGYIGHSDFVAGGVSARIGAELLPRVTASDWRDPS